MSAKKYAYHKLTDLHTSSPATTPPTGTKGKRPGVSRMQTADGESSPTRRYSPATKPASTSPGSKTGVWQTSTNLPDPDVLADEIVENLESALEGFRSIIASLNAGKKEAVAESPEDTPIKRSRGKNIAS